MTWKEIIKEDDYRFGRCQRNSGASCIRPLQSPVKRYKAGSDPKGKICMYCEDDASEYSHIPDEVLGDNYLDFFSASMEQRRQILDDYVKRNPKYKPMGERGRS